MRCRPASRGCGMNGKLLLGAAAALAILIGLAYLARDAPQTLGGTFHVIVEGPDGATWIDGDFTVSEASPYTVLAEAAHRTGYAVVHDGSAGSCYLYVRSIGGAGASGASGWVYEVTHANGTAQHPDVSADCYPLAYGDVVRWHWTETGVPEG